MSALEAARPEICPACGHCNLTPIRLAKVVELEPLFIREPEVCRLLGGISRTTLLAWRRSGLFEFVKYGETTLYPLDAIKAFARGKRGEAAPS